MTTSIGPFDGPPGEWDAFVAGQPGGTHAHRLGWVDVIRDVFGHEVVALAARSEGALTGVLPLVRMKSLVFGRHLVSMPFLNYGGPLGTADAVRALSARAVELGRADRARLTELRSRTELPLALAVSRRKITVVLDLPATSEDLLKGFPSKLRSQVRRPEKEGVTVRFGADQIDVFHRVFARHMRDLGTPALPRRLFSRMAQQFGEDAWFAVAWHGDTPVAGGAGIRWNGESEIIWASSLQQYNRLAPNMLLYRAAMEHAIAGGATRFNFGRCTPGSGTHRFKQQWGGRDEPLWWYQDSPGGVSATPNPDEGRYRMAVKVWQRLPVGVATALGSRIVGGIP